MRYGKMVAHLVYICTYKHKGRDRWALLLSRGEGSTYIERDGLCSSQENRASIHTYIQINVLDSKINNRASISKICIVNYDLCNQESLEIKNLKKLLIFILYIF